MDMSSETPAQVILLTRPRFGNIIIRNVMENR